MSTTNETRVRDLFQIPERIGKMDFTVTLADGIARAEETVQTYVLTPAIVQAYEQALGLIGQSIAASRSEATYLHGSFGAGKSHFMAMLSLLLADNEQAWRAPELHALRVKFPWIGQKKILELHIHMLDQPDVETPIFRAYLAYLKAHHPGATMPALFADEELFDDAAALLDRLGDAKFFGLLDALKSPTDEAAAGELGARWGKAKGTRGAGWDRTRFEAARSSSEPKVRAELLTALTRTHYKAFASSSRAFVDIDRGLGIMSRHARELGYDAVVLLLDEMILWLSMMASQPGRLGEAVQRLVKLVEANDRERPAPICSFIARQRDLKDMVGEELAGPENARLNHVLSHGRGRFDEIKLGDNNLPAIVERRVLIPRDAAARQTLDETFRRLQSESQQKGSWNTLLGTNHDAAAFRSLYPFSPVLIDALVALSNSLQRQRTAIKLLTELLMRHIEDLRLGQLVGIGDLFDVMAEGERAAEGPLAIRFETARKLYKHELLPLIQQANDTSTPARCQRERKDHPADLGCANCPELACRNDNRVIKTLLIAALVPGVPAFRELTAKRLVELNHGHLRSPIPGRETTALLGKLRKWASQVGQIRISEQQEYVSIQLDGIDIRPIIEQARDIDSPSRRQSVLCNLLFQAMKISGEPFGDIIEKREWRSTRRPGSLRFGNVRRMAAEQLRCPDDQDWRVIIDYPFDDAGFGPLDDERVISSFTAQGSGSWTMVWLPSFFSEASNKALGELARLQHILQDRATTERYVGHLNVEQQEQAIMTLRNLESQKRSQLLEVLAKAYGLAHNVADDDADLDPARRLDTHIHLLKAGAELMTLTVGSLEESIEVHVQALLAARYPRHPQFERPLTAPRVEAMLEHFRQIVEAPDKKIGLERKELEEVRGTLGALGLVRVTESTVHLRSDGSLQTIESRRRQRGTDHPTVGEVCRWLDENQQMGLQPEAQALMVRAYALAESRALVRGGKPYEPTAGKPLPDDVILERPDLPSQQEWSTALDLAGHAFGVTLRGRALTGDNLRRFADEVGKKVSAQSEAALRLPHALDAWDEALGSASGSDRLATAKAAAELIAVLQGQPPAAQVRAMAGFTTTGTSVAAIGRSLATAIELVRVLDDPLILGVFQQLVGAREQNPAIVPILDELTITLRQNELQRSLAERIRQLAREGQQILAKKPGGAGTGSTGTGTGGTGTGTGTGGTGAGTGTGTGGAGTGAGTRGTGTGTWTSGTGTGGTGGAAGGDGNDTRAVLETVQKKVTGRQAALQALSELVATLRAAIESGPEDISLVVAAELRDGGKR